VAEAFEAPELGGAPARAIGLEALRSALGRPPVWLVVWSVEALLALAPAMLLHGWLKGAISHHYEPGRLFGNLDTYFRFDHQRETETLDGAMGMLGGVLATLSVLFGAFAAGGWLQVFLERTHGHSLQRFFLGGARYFWRFFRLTLGTVLALSLWTWIVHGWPWSTIVLRGICRVPASDLERLETFTSEWSAFYVRAAQQGIYALGVALVLVWGDYSRTRLALHDTSSAAWAGLCTLFTLLRHPVQTLRPILGLFVLEVALVVGIGFLARAVEGVVARESSLAGVGLLLLLGQLALLWRVVLRGARYHAAVQVSQRVVRPIARPDPWKASLGPEGGPRYPIGGDEYGMSL
jgi:hypothetical protein